MALVLATTGLVYYAVNAEGQRVLRADLHDGGIWVSNQEESLIGRQNKPLSQLDTAVPASSVDADVLQQGAAVIAVDNSSFTLTPVSASLGQAVDDNKIATAGPAVLGGGTVAVVNTDSGEVWATRVDPATGVNSLAELDREAKPLAKAGAGAHLAASTTGVVFASTPGADEVTVVSPSDSGFGKATKQSLDAEVSGGIKDVSAVGDVPAVLDATNRLILPAASISVSSSAEEPMRLQQPGPSRDRALVETSQGLVTVGLDDGSVETVVEVAGTPSAPVRLGRCDWGVWSNGREATVAVACDGEDPVVGPSFEVPSDAVLVFRVNRNDLLLNDVKNGGVWNVDGANATEITDWESLQEDQKPDDSNPNDSEAPEVKQNPDARDDDLGARPGFTTALSVLDNDLVSGGGVLAIVGTKGLEDEAGLTVRPAPDRQSILLTLPPTATRDVSFQYTVDDGTGGDKATDSARVSVRVRPSGAPVAPTRPENWDEDTQPVYPVTGGGQLELSVLPDWRDPEFGDRVTLDDVPGQKGLVTTITPEGLLRIQVPPEGAPNRVDYQVSTGGPPSTGSVALNVLRPGSLKPVSPQALPDVAAGQVGAPIKVRPLDNDIPGADPSDPQARLEIAGQVQPRQGLKVRTDLESGEVTVTARQPGTYSLAYAAGFGVAKRSQGDIRVVVDPASDEADEPIASPDVTTVRGMAPVIVDVLANDYDPRGRLLAVTSARPINDDSALEVAVLDGRWLRISATTTELTPNPQAVSYELSNGAGRATGIVSVTQKPPLPSEKNSPIPGDDEVTVRVADSAIVPVLANDTTPSGDPLGLVVPSTTDVLGELTVEPPVGHAYVVGNRVRYVAPASVDGPQTVAVQYVVENTADRTASPAAGTLRVRLNPEPSDTNPNSPPTPRSIEARVVAGDTVNLRLPLVGNDPDGDTVSIVGVSKAPVHGRLLSLGATSLAYQSFPGTPGFDEFSYVVTDRFGAQAEGDIRVVVTNAGSPQAPVAVADVVTADLNRKVELDVLANDLRSPGTRVTILGLENAPDGVAHETDTDLVTLTSSDNSHRPLSFSYRITNGLDDSVGSVTVKSVKGYNNPPVVRDAVAKPEGDSATVTVDVLQTAFDIDGEGAPLTVDPIEADGVEVDGGKITLPVLDLPQTVPFRVADAQGAATAAVIYVPARPTDFPYLRADASIQVGVGKRVVVPLDDLVVDPEGDPVVITTVDQIVAGPPQMLTASAPKKDPVLQVTAGNLAGPGVVTFQVSDRAKLSDPDAHLATISVPVQIGDGEPILTCPGDPLPVIEGGPERTYDVASLCHVWTPSPADAAALTFSSEWAAGQQPADVTLSPDERGFKLRAGVAARGQVGTINIGTAGSDATGELHVKVFEAGPPSLSPMSLETEAEQSVSVDVAAYASSPFGVDAKYKITEVVPVTAAAPTPEQTGDTGLTFTPREFGTFVYQVTVADDGGAADSQRPTATAQITLSVVSAPEAPTGVTWDGSKQDGAVQLSWSAPNANGGAISSYTVYYTGPTSGSQECPAPRCTITNLENGDPYSFQVTANNTYGESEKSKPAKGTADRVPGAVVGVAVTLQRDQEVTLEWSPPADAGEYSDIKNYYVSWKGGGTPAKLSGGQLTYKAKLGANGQNTTFNVWAENEAGMSTLKSSAEGMGAGKPATPVMGTPATTNRAGNTAKAVTISWGAVDANGPGPVEYTVTRTGGSGSQVVCDWTPNNSCADDLGNDGTTYQYKVQARNAEATAARESNPQLHISSQSQAVSVEAAAPPDEANITEFVATGDDGRARVTFNVGPSHGKTNTIQCNPSCGTLGSTTVSNSGQSGLTATISGYSNGQNARFEVRTCNGSSESAQTGPACSAWVTASTTTYGPIPNPSISASGSGQCISWSFSGNANGKAVNFVISMNGSTIRSGQSGVGAYSGNGTECVGYSQTRSFRIDVTDTALAPGQGSARAGRSDGPKSASTDPPPVGLSLGKGASAQGQPGCNTPSCRYLTATTSNFPAGVTCNIIGATGPGGTAGFIPWNQGGNEAKQSPNYYGFSGHTLTVRCSGGGQTRDAQIVW